MRFKSSLLGNLMLLVIAFLLVIGFKIWGITGKNTSEKAEFLSAGSGQKSECFVGILDAERSATNLAAKHFTCADSARFLFGSGGTYTSPITETSGAGFKIAVPAGWEIEEWASVREDGTWLKFSQFSEKNQSSFEISSQSFTIFVKNTPAKTLAELKKDFPAYSVTSVGGFDALQGNDELLIFSGPKTYWQLSPVPEFVNTLERIAK